MMRRSTIQLLWRSSGFSVMICAKVKRRLSAHFRPISCRGISAAKSRSSLLKSSISYWRKNMSKFDERQKAFETKFVLDEELHFKATAAAVKKIAKDVAGKIGQNDAYSGVVIGVLLEDGPQAALKKIANDLSEKGLKTEADDVA